MRDAFESWVRERYFCTDYSFNRTADNIYYNSVSKVGPNGNAEDMAGVQMLWEAYRAGAGFQRESDATMVERGMGDIGVGRKVAGAIRRNK